MHVAVALTALFLLAPSARHERAAQQPSLTQGWRISGRARLASGVQPVVMRLDAGGWLGSTFQTEQDRAANRAARAATRGTWRVPGQVRGAAPTLCLRFTPELPEQCRSYSITAGRTGLRWGTLEFAPFNVTRADLAALAVEDARSALSTLPRPAPPPARARASAPVPRSEPRNTAAYRAMAARPTRADSLARCATAGAANQRACLYAHIAETDAPLNRAYADLINALRRRDRSREPASVRSLREEQRAWLIARDRACRPNRPSKALWAAARARCLGSKSDVRARELRRMLPAAAR